MTVAALYLSLLGLMFRMRLRNQRWRHYSRMLISENLWRAQRYGIREGLIDFGRGTIVPYADLYEELLDLVAEDSEKFDCVAELEHGRTVLDRGTSADQQVAIYRDAIAEGTSPEEALRMVVDFLVAETVRDI